MWGQYLFLLVLVSTALPSLIPLEILVTNYTSIENGMFVFKYQVGQDAVIPLSFTPKVLNVNEVEVIWEFKSISDGEMEEIFIFDEKPRSFKERVEFSGDISREDVSITIHNTSLSDSGYYTCHILNHKNMKVNEKTVLLEIFQTFPSLIPLENLVTNHTSIENGTFVFKYQVGQDAVIPLSFTPNVLNVNEVEVIWEFKSISDGEMEKIFIFDEKPRSFKERVEFSGNISREDVSITIHNTSLSDSGYYTCQVSNYNNMKVNEKTVLLEIFNNPHHCRCCSANFLNPLCNCKGEICVIIPYKVDTISKLVFILIVLCMAIITCTVISFVTKKTKEYHGGNRQWELLERQ